MLHRSIYHSLFKTLLYLGGFHGLINSLTDSHLLLQSQATSDNKDDIETNQA